MRSSVREHEACWHPSHQCRMGSWDYDGRHNTRSIRSREFAQTADGSYIGQLNPIRRNVLSSRLPAYWYCESVYDSVPPSNYISGRAPQLNYPSGVTRVRCGPPAVLAQIRQCPGVRMHHARMPHGRRAAIRSCHISSAGTRRAG